MRTSVDTKHLPTTIAEPNAISVPYTTNVLFPKLGPLAVKRYVRIAARLLTDYAAMIKIADLDKKPGRPPRHGRLGNDALAVNPVFADPKAVAKATYADLVYEFRKFDRQMLYTEATTNVAHFKPMRSVAGAGTVQPTTGRGTLLGTSSIAAVGEVFTDLDGVTFRGANGALTDLIVSDTGDTLTVTTARGQQTGEVNVAVDGRIVTKRSTPAEIMLPGGAMLSPLITSANGTLTPDEVTERTQAQTESYETALMYSWLSRPNAVAADLFESVLIQPEGNVFKDEIRTANDSAAAIAITLERTSRLRREALGNLYNDYTDDRIRTVKRYIDMAFELCNRLDVDLDKMPQLYARDQAFQDRVVLYVITRIDTERPISDRLMPLPTDSQIVESREWAFQRRERLDITMGTPTLRGPISAIGVTPNSEQTDSETNVTETFQGFETFQGTERSNQMRSAGLSVTSFQMALSSMIETGQISDQSFQNDTALTATLRERRRERINEVIDNVSRNNESHSFSATRQMRSVTRESTTRGKDEKLSTTEVRFQVAASATVDVYLEDVDLVWCPRVEVPFLYLHQLVIDERNRAEERYKQQNQITDPTRPVLRYETASFEFELSIQGDKHYQAQSFSRRAPSNLSGDDGSGGRWEIDRAASSVRFRNGRWGDYNWNERGNWDDLEVHNSEFIEGPYLDDLGNVTGSAFLETTDPERWNKGFMTYTIVMRRLDAGTVAALLAWEQDKQDAVAERAAVEVRAKQYGEMQMREMIARFEEGLEQRNEVYASLIKLVYAGIAPRHRSFYAETISSCIDWSSASMTYEQPDLETLPFPEYPPTHFMNVAHVRLVLPINRTAEDSFFESLANADTYHAAAAQEVRDFVATYRTRLGELQVRGQDKLDTYRREMVLGQHVEAVLSNHPFAE